MYLIQEKFYRQKSKSGFPLLTPQTRFQRLSRQNRLVLKLVMRQIKQILHKYIFFLKQHPRNQRSRPSPLVKHYPLTVWCHSVQLWASCWVLPLRSMKHAQLQVFSSFTLNRNGNIPSTCRTCTCMYTYTWLNSYYCKGLIQAVCKHANAHSVIKDFSQLKPLLILWWST